MSDENNTDETPPPDVGRRHLVALVTDLSWLIGASQQAGVMVPTRIEDHLDDTIRWLAGTT
jgi:hypothetical protein